MAKDVSKTARASVQAGAGVKKLVAVAWAFKNRIGVMQTKPYATFYSLEEMGEFKETHPEGFSVIQWSDVRRK